MFVMQTLMLVELYDKGIWKHVLEACHSQATGYVSGADIKQPDAPYVVLASKLQG